MYVYTLELIILGDNVTMCANIPCGGYSLSLSFFTSREFFGFFFPFGGGWRTFISSFFFFLNVSFNPTLFLSAGTLPTGAARMKPDPPPAIVAISFEIVRIQNKKVPGNVNFFFHVNFGLYFFIFYYVVVSTYVNS